MYSQSRTLKNGHTTGLMNKNLQVVSFDLEWKEIYLGTAREDTFRAVCPESSVNKVILVDGKRFFTKDGVTGGGLNITAVKWCPLDKSTVLVIGNQYGVQFYNWDGSHLFYYYDFRENGIGVDEKLATGSITKGISAVGQDNISVGTHTGTILLFRISPEVKNSLSCFLIDSQRIHERPITELASTRINGLDILASGDEDGTIHLWRLKKQDKHQPHASLDHLTTVETPSSNVTKGFPVTAMCIWNKIPRGALVAAYGSGTIRIFGLAGNIIAQINAHSGWITAMDLASRSGILVSVAEDCFIKVWQLSSTGRIVQHKFAKMVESLVTGVKFLDPEGSSFAISSYDSDVLQVYKKQ